MDKLTNFDLELIQEVENDARQPLSQIAKKLKTSQQVISYRLSSLEKRKIIGGYYTFINLVKLGYTNYRTMIRLNNLDREKHQKIIDYLMKHNNVLWIVDCSGRADMIVNFMAKNIIDYSRILGDFRKKFPEQIQNYDVLTTVEIIYFGRDYFTKVRREIKEHAFFGKSETLDLDETASKILSLISENARISSVEIADKLKISPNTVILRLKELKKSGVIQGFKPLIHLENTPYASYKALIKFQNITEKREKEIIAYLKSNLNVVGAIKLVGSWDFEVEFEVQTKDEMLELTRDIRDKFKDIINEFEVLSLFHEYRYNFFPKELNSF